MSEERPSQFCNRWCGVCMGVVGGTLGLKLPSVSLRSRWADIGSCDKCGSKAAQDKEVAFPPSLPMVMTLTAGFVGYVLQCLFCVVEL